MHKIIKEILDSDYSNDKKSAMLIEIKDSIAIAEKIFAGEFYYCKKCGDYFLSKSFFKEKETIEEKICTYADPLNSSGDIYENRQVRYTYMYCPKGCKHIINREVI